MAEEIVVEVEKVYCQKIHGGQQNCPLFLKYGFDRGPNYSLFPFFLGQRLVHVDDGVAQRQVEVSGGVHSSLRQRKLTSLA